MLRNWCVCAYTVFIHKSDKFTFLKVVWRFGTLFMYLDFQKKLSNHNCNYFHQSSKKVHTWKSVICRLVPCGRRWGGGIGRPSQLRFIPFHLQGMANMKPFSVISCHVYLNLIQKGSCKFFLKLKRFKKRQFYNDCHQFSYIAAPTSKKNDDKLFRKRIHARIWL